MQYLDWWTKYYSSIKKQDAPEESLSDDLDTSESESEELIRTNSEKKSLKDKLFKIKSRKMSNRKI